jgi:hypothetical protein
MIIGEKLKQAEINPEAQYKFNDLILADFMAKETSQIDFYKSKTI